MTGPAAEFVRPRSKAALDQHVDGILGGSSIAFGEQRAVGVLPPVPDSWIGELPHLRSDMNAEDRVSRHTPELFDASTLTTPPRLQAESPRDLLERIRLEAEAKGRRAAQHEIRQLHERIGSLEREVASLRLKKPQVEWGQCVVVHGIEIPEALTGLIDAIETSRFILELEDDWDDDGAAGFSEQMWRRAAETLLSLVTGLACHQDVTPLTIEILPGSNGGLDIDARLEGRELLISIPADPQTESRFYGDDGQGGDQVKATFATSNVPEWLSVWMTP